MLLSLQRMFCVYVMLAFTLSHNLMASVYDELTPLSSGMVIQSEYSPLSCAASHGSEVRRRATQQWTACRRVYHDPRPIPSTIDLTRAVPSAGRNM